MNAEQLPYLTFCEGKAFLASKVSEEVKPLSTMKTKLEVGDKDGRGPLLGFSVTSQALKAKGFEEGKPLGPGQILINEDLGLHHAMLNELGGGWKEAYWAYGKQTKFGHLILAGNVENFAKWAASKACRDEVGGVDEGRLFAYIEHQQGDTNPGQGYIVSVNPSGKKGSATIAEGIGYVVFADGGTYHGELAEGRRNGRGSHTYASGAKYVGEWQNDNMHGQGSHTYASGAKYVGEWQNDNMHGQGSYTFGKGEWEGDKYEGQWNEGLKHGTGSYTYSNGGKYVGEWQDDEKHSQGCYTHASGNTYVGQWKDDKKHGQGSYTYSDGASYVGEWENGNKHGQGCYTFPSGNSWTGPYVQGKKHGVGVKTLTDGTTVEEEYVNGVLKQ